MLTPKFPGWGSRCNTVHGTGADSSRCSAARPRGRSRHARSIDPQIDGRGMNGIAEWLASIGLSEYAQRFADNAIDLSVVRDLTEQDLKELGVLLGHRRKILRAIAELDGLAPAPTDVTSPNAVTSR